MLPCFTSETNGLPLHATSAAGLPALRERLNAPARRWLEQTGFAAQPHEVALLPDEQGAVQGAVLGLGDGSVDHWALGALPFALPAGTTWSLADAALPVAPAAIGWALGAYRFDRYRKPKRAPAKLVLPAEAASAGILAEAVWRTRDLINRPANDLGPQELAEAVAESGRAHGAACRLFEGEALAAGFPAIAAVGAGSARPPRVAVLEWGDADAPLVALCGKGVCFDTGGLDLKPSAAMLRMKKDMGGAAVVLGVAEAVMRLRLPVRLLVLVGAIENCVGGAAFRPGDVLRTRAGLTVEVGNTDAEGRLVLADLLTFAEESAPALLIDVATLTGAARAALGPDLPALFSPDPLLAAALVTAGREVDDPVWQLPLQESYTSWLDSRVADTNNVSARPMAGAILGALFLRRFVRRTLAWAHLDAYAWNDGMRPGRPEGGEAQTLRALVRFISARFSGRPCAEQ